MTIYQLRKSAEEMGVSFKDAVLCRFRFVREQLLEELADLERLADRGDDTGAVLFPMTLDTFIELAKEQRALFMAIKAKRSPAGSKITGEQIQQARSYPIDRLVRFNRGIAITPCPKCGSTTKLKHDRTHNRAHCWNCPKSFNPIDYLVISEGIDFISAVRRLAT